MECPQVSVDFFHMTGPLKGVKWCSAEYCGLTSCHRGQQGWLLQWWGAPPRGPWGLDGAGKRGRGLLHPQSKDYQRLTECQIHRFISIFALPKSRTNCVSFGSGFQQRWRWNFDASAAAVFAGSELHDCSCVGDAIAVLAIESAIPGPGRGSIGDGWQFLEKHFGVHNWKPELNTQIHSQARSQPDFHLLIQLLAVGPICSPLTFGFP